MITINKDDPKLYTLYHYKNKFIITRIIGYLFIYLFV